jgi:hypothetical protein
MLVGQPVYRTSSNWIGFILKQPVPASFALAPSQISFEPTEAGIFHLGSRFCSTAFGKQSNLVPLGSMSL